MEKEFELSEVTMTKAEFMAYMKTFLPKVKKTLAEADKKPRIPEFQKGATEAVKFLVTNFKDVKIFSGKSKNMEAALAYSVPGDSRRKWLFFADSLDL